LEDSIAWVVEALAVLHWLAQWSAPSAVALVLWQFFLLPQSFTDASFAASDVWQEAGPPWVLVLGGLLGGRDKGLWEVYPKPLHCWDL